MDSSKYSSHGTKCRDVLTRADLNRDSQQQECDNSAPMNDVLFSIPTKLKRCGIETKLLLESGRPTKANKKTVKAIQNAVTNALAWN